MFEGGNEMRAMNAARTSIGTETYRRVVANSNVAPRCTLNTVGGSYGTLPDGILLMLQAGQTVAALLSGVGAARNAVGPGVWERMRGTPGQ